MTDVSTRFLKYVSFDTMSDPDSPSYPSTPGQLTFAQSLRSRTFEPDEPNYTTRISGLMKKKGDYALSILKSAGGDPSSCRRYFFSYSDPKAGQGHFIHTYMGDGNPLPSFEGEPVQIEIAANDPKTLAASIWDGLNEENKVSLFVRYIDLKNGCWESVLLNKHEEKEC